jgi:hypothetical protein
MIEQMPESTGKIMAFKMSGWLHGKDYKTFVPLIDEAVAREGKIRFLALFEKFHGWDLHALWDDTVFATKHCHDIERIALVGDKTWESWMAKVCVPFTKAQIRYFDVHEINSAWAWLREGLDAAAKG